MFGSAWQIGIGGLLAGLVLLMVPGRVSWLLAAEARTTESTWMRLEYEWLRDDARDRYAVTAIPA